MKGGERVTPVLAERLCYTAVCTGSYESAARVADKWGVKTDDSSIHRYVAAAGERAAAVESRQVERALDVSTRSEVVEEAAREIGSAEFSLVIEMDGWLRRERGSDWAMKPAEAAGSRVEWHENKTATIFRVEDRGQSMAGRSFVVERFVVCCRDDPYEFGRRVHAQAIRRGLCQAQAVWIVSDGGIWIWNIAKDRFGHARGVLDFYHAAQHLWSVAQALYPDQLQSQRQWVEPLLHQLHHGEHGRVVETLADLVKELGDKPAQETVEKEAAYFEKHRQHLDYPRAEAAGCPIGSGAIESTCAQLQTRFKRPGQFWTRPGADHLMALEIARRNKDWSMLWPEIPSQL